MLSVLLACWRRSGRVRDTRGANRGPRGDATQRRGLIAPQRLCAAALSNQNKLSRLSFPRARRFAISATAGPGVRVALFVSVGQRLLLRGLALLLLLLVVCEPAAGASETCRKTIEAPTSAGRLQPLQCLVPSGCACGSWECGWWWPGIREGEAHSLRSRRSMPASPGTGRGSPSPAPPPCSPGSSGTLPRTRRRTDPPSCRRCRGLRRAVAVSS